MANRDARKPRRKTAGQRNSFRVIGGRWRGRRLEFPPLEAVRPSPDRVRETVFNWLAPFMDGATCLDLFAGSGALGLEALSRGAAFVVFVDRDRRLVDAIARHLALLDAASQARAVQSDAQAYLGGAGERFDIVFVDPPYSSGLLVPCLAALAPRLKPVNRVYIECPAGQTPPLPGGWELLKSRRAGMVGYHCATYRAPQD